MGPYVPLEIAEIAVPLGIAAALAARSARRERARISRAQEAARTGRMLLEPEGTGALDRLHERRMRRAVRRAGGRARRRQAV
jgi:hypothetical protein